MAFVVDVERVHAVRVGEEWAAVVEGSFQIDSMAYAQEGREVGDRVMGFSAALGGGGVLAAPLTSLTGVRYAPPDPA
jgi:hypothetical protein